MDTGVKDYTITINGKPRRFRATPDMPLLWALRQEAGLPGTKFGCGWGLCGACTVHLDGSPTRACQTTVDDVGTAKVTTIEGLAADPLGRRLVDAWLAIDVMQCGYCQAGQIMSAHALLKANPRPDDATIDAAMDGNICRCGTYPRIVRAIERAAGGRS